MHNDILYSINNILLWLHYLLESDDYVFEEPYSIEISVGQTNISFNIPIIDDNIFEENENFDIIIIPESLPNGFTRHNPGETRITIVDNDGKLLV